MILNGPGETKFCPDCRQELAVPEFTRNTRSRDGLAKSGCGPYCKPCHNLVTRRDKDRHGGARNYHLRRRYGITVEHFERMFAEQAGRCAICREAPAEQVDHDHETQRVRGLLCFNCDGALGQFRDRRELMLRAMAYLDTSGLPGAHTMDELPPFHFGMHVGDFTSHRPADEPAPY